MEVSFPFFRHFTKLIIFTIATWLKMSSLNTKYTTHKIIAELFRLCVRFLEFLGKTFKISYEQISIIVNLYIQGTILMISGLLPLFASIYSIIHCIRWIETLCMIASLGYASLFLAGYSRLLSRYKNTSAQYFDLCVDDLMALSKRWGMHYYMVNLLIFVVWWLSLICINVFAAIWILNSPTT